MALLVLINVAFFPDASFGPHGDMDGLLPWRPDSGAQQWRPPKRRQTWNAAAPNGSFERKTRVMMPLFVVNHKIQTGVENC